MGKEKKSNSEVKGSKFRLTRAETFVSAPMSEVRKAVLDYGKYSTIIPAFQKSKVLKQDGTAAQVFLQIPFLKGAANIWTVESFTAPVADGKGEKITGTKIKSNIDDIKATWLYRPVDDAHTVLTLEIYVSLDVPAPLSLITSETEDACGHGVRGVKAHAESNVSAKTPAK